MSERELKEVDRNEINYVLESMQEFLKLSSTDYETAEMQERVQLFISLRFLKSENLEKRLNGLNDIRSMIERV